MSDSWKIFSENYKRYNLGCGLKIYENFMNVGYWSQLETDVLYKNLNNTVNTVMFNHDLRNGVPAVDNSLDLIYHSHMLEHLTYSDGIEFNRECFRALKPGGRMRILVPDLELWIDAYYKNNDFFFEQYRKYGGIDASIYCTKAAVFMGMLHNHEHKCGYDFESLEWVLKHLGFSNINKTLYGDSSIEDISIIEPLDPIKIMESLCVECIKPENF
jgi:predicted SAM-dependent methyltransferase